MKDTLRERFRFAVYVLERRVLGQDADCPYCGHCKTRRLRSRRLMMQLRRCDQCGLYFRYPKDEPSWSTAFYSEGYHEGGYVTELPDLNELKDLMDSSFKDTRQDFSRYIRWVQQFVDAGSLLDFGASWGYGTWQFAQSGFQATGYEIDPRRASFGREQLGLKIVDGLHGLSAFQECQFDVVFTAHTLEHLAHPREAFDEFRRILRVGGWLISIVPNCSGMEDKTVFRRKMKWAFGRKHPLAYNAEFFKRNLPSHGFDVLRVTTKLDTFDARTDEVDCQDAELLVASRKL